MDSSASQSHESRRLRALHEQVILDTLPEERFDRLTRLAQSLFSAPIALVSLIDSERQWFKSRQGTEICETHRIISFCAHAILSPDILEITDARLDQRFADNAMVTGEPFIRFYAGAPISTPDGYRIGTLCVIDTKPRQLKEHERKALKDLASCVEDEINQIQLAKQSLALKQAHHLAQVIGRAQQEFIRETNRPQAFDTLLTDILTLTKSHYGFIGEALFAPDSRPHLKIHAITNNTGSKEGKYLELHDLDTLFGAALISGDPVINNNPELDKRRSGLPEGHPALNAVMSIPIHFDNELVAMLGVANRHGGYSEDIIEFLNPLLITLGQLMVSVRTRKQRNLSERRLKSIIDGTRTATWECDLLTGKAYFNDRWAEIVGYTLADLQPTTIDTFRNLVHPDDAALVERAHEQHYNGKTDFMDCEARMRHKEGRWVWIHGRGRVVAWTETGKPALMLGTHTDISDRKRTESELLDQAAHTNAIVDNIIDGIITFDENHAIQSFNPAAEKIFGYSASQVVGQSLNTLMPSPSFEDIGTYICNQHTPCDLHKEDRNREAEGLHKDGTVIPLELTITEIMRQGKPNYLAMLRDITERKRISRMKSEFVSTVSHELRTPLTSIAGSLGLIVGGAMGELPNQLREMISIAYKNSQRLTHLINDLLDIEKVIAGKIHFDMKPQPLMPLIVQALESDQGYGSNHHVTLSLIGEVPDATVRVDGERLLQVLSNLLSNAIKFSPDKGVVEVAVVANQTSVRVSVTDKGPGIAVDFRPCIFQKFAQADSSDTRKKGGTGLGLAITKELIEHMGGKIGFDSEENKGASFYFDLPLCHMPQTKPDNHVTAAHNPNSPRILIVEDEPEIARLLVLILTQAGYTTDVARTGEQTIKALQAVSYHAMTLDLYLPDINGLDLITQVHLQPHTENLPIIVISASMGDERLAINDQLSEIEWISKPIDQAHLLAIVHRLLSREPLDQSHAAKARSEAANAATLRASRKNQWP